MQELTLQLDTQNKHSEYIAQLGGMSVAGESRGGRGIPGLQRGEL